MRNACKRMLCCSTLFTKGAVILAAGMISTAALANTIEAKAIKSNSVTFGSYASSANHLSYVGSKTCAECHRSEARLWRGSQHKLAMQHATDKSVLGDFNNTYFNYFGIRSRFYKKEGKFFVDTDNADGKLRSFQIEYTFGIYPLQQYLIEFPDGRIQALSIAWDSRPKALGGQRWFHLYPKQDIQYGDPLHWTKLNQNWNHMCAECHSTDIHKNYDATTDRFTTTWSEISVGCEACHGPGSRHVAWAHERSNSTRSGTTRDPTKGLEVQFGERHGVSWSENPKTGLPQRSKPPTLLRKEVETCGRCHARRSEFSEDWNPGRWLSDTHEVSLLRRGIFWPDGQMRDDQETYNYAPFKQSEMFAKGVTCSDCHDPHSAKLRLPQSSVCLQCHTAKKYATAAHGHHDAKSSVTCISCHMPVRSYMVVDRRHDHSFRIPRPDLTEKYGIPNTCNDCHHDKSAQWAAATIKQWFGGHREHIHSYVGAFNAAWTDQPNAEQLLAKVASDGAIPAFVRASAYNELNNYASVVSEQLTRIGLSDPDPIVRVGTLDMLIGLPADQLWPLVSPLLADPVRGVRIKAVSVLAGVTLANLSAADRERFEHTAEEFVAAQELNADRPEARTALGTFFAQRALVEKAKVQFTAALRLSPQYVPAAINLADLYRSLGQDHDGARVLQKAITVSPHDADLHYALGLTLIRLKHPDNAIMELQKTTKLAPDQSQYAYVFAIALSSVGRTHDAIMTLKQNLNRHPTDRNTLIALVSFYHNLNDSASAIKYAKQLVDAYPSDTEAAKILGNLQH